MTANSIISENNVIHLLWTLFNYNYGNQRRFPVNDVVDNCMKWKILIVIRYLLDIYELYDYTVCSDKGK